jgi:hypothetical protein
MNIFVTKEINMLGIRKWWNQRKLRKQLKILGQNEPLDIEKKWLAEAKAKVLKPSIAACNEMLSVGNMSTVLKYEDINIKSKVGITLPVEFIKDNLPGIGFTLMSNEPLHASGVFYKESFGLDGPLVITTGEGRTLHILGNSVQDFRNDFPAKPNRLHGRITNIGTIAYNDIRGVYIRQIVRLDDADITYPATIIKERAFLKFDDPSWNRTPTLLGIRLMSKKEQYCEVKIDDDLFDFYTVESIRSQLIDSSHPTNIKSFKKRANAIRSAFAILSGKYYRTNVFYVTSKEADFSVIENVYYEMEEPSWLGEFQLIDLSLFSKYFEDQNEETRNLWRQYHELFPRDIFSKLCQEICNNEKIARVVDLILSGNANLNAIQQGAIYSVAIETFANDIYENNEAKLKPVPDKPTFKDLREDFINVLNKHASKIGETAATIFQKKIMDLNNPTNRDRLFKPFELYGIKLTEAEISSLDNRNDFLHGRSPHEDVSKIKKVALDLHFLLCCLLLKYVGYSGYINNPAIHFVAKNIAANGDYLPTFDSTKIMSMEKIEELRGQGKLEAAREALDNTINYLKAYQMLAEVQQNFIKII